MKKHLILVGIFCWMVSLHASSQEPVNPWKKQLLEASALIKQNPEAAEDAFDTLLKGGNKKNPELLVEIGEAYLKEGDTETAMEYAERAKKVNGKYADAYVLSGDIAMAKKNVNLASSEYNQAIYFDENCCEAYLKYADVYQKVNPQLSIEMLQRLDAKMPDEVQVDRLMGEIYYGMGEYSKAIESYDEYMEAGTPDVDDFTRYATLLYLNKEFDASLRVANEGMALDADNEVLQRLSIYDLYELGNYDAGIEKAKTFLARSDSPENVYLDYFYYGRLLKEKKQYDEALVQLNKSLALDGSKVEIYQVISAIYEERQDYPQAITAYKKYMDDWKKPGEMGRLFCYGRLNYLAASDSTLKDLQPVYLAEADAVFARVMESAPENYLGSFWRARTNSLLDPETTDGLAKPYYEMALAILEQEPDASVPQKVECLSYLGYYYFVKEDYPKSKEYWNKILMIDPENEMAKTALEGMK